MRDSPLWFLLLNVKLAVGQGGVWSNREEQLEAMALVRVIRITQQSEQETMVGEIIWRNNSWYQTMTLETRKMKESKMTQVFLS